MAKPQIPNQKSKYNALSKRLAKYVLLVQNVYETYNLEAAKMASVLDYDGSKPFSFSDYPLTKDRLQKLLSGWQNDLTGVIMTGTAKEWGNSNLTQDLLADKVLSYYYGKEHGRRKRKYYLANSEALKAFQDRVDNGMSLSQKIWNHGLNYRHGLEAALSVGIQKGMSAVTLSKRISKYLDDFDSLRKDYKQKYGKEVDCLNCEYRSIRLARTEINMAYRTAEQKRWQQFDFVLGYEIKVTRSPKHVPDICDDLAGKYPKDFKFGGWHPNCMCYVIPILKTEDEFFSDDDKGGENTVTEFPRQFSDWVADNHERIKTANSRGTLPYFLEDNKNVLECALLIDKSMDVGSMVQEVAESIAVAHGCTVTPINYKSFSSLYRKLTNPFEPTRIEDIKDAVRNTIITDADGIPDVIADLKRLDTFSRYKPQDTEYGYTGNIVNLLMPNGIKAEIQVNTPKMIYAKEKVEDARRILGEELYEKIHKETGLEGGLGHKYYEIGRKLDPEHDHAKLEEIIRKSVEYYKHFR